jgi:hypothetical protein
MNNILDRVNQVCSSVRESVHEDTKFKKLVSKIRKTFKKHDFDIAIKTKREKDWDIDKFYVMAYYDSCADLCGDTAIEVVIHHNLVGDETFGSHQITNFLVEVYDAVVHELRHQHQSRSRKFRYYNTKPSTPYDVYLSDYDELDAYALNISIELLRVMDAVRARRNLSRISKMSKMRTGLNLTSPILRNYTEHFVSGPVIKRLSKKIYFYLNTIDRRHIFM